MSDSLEQGFQLPSEQQSIRDNCFHPSGTFVEFPKEEIEQSIPARFEKIARKYPDRLAIRIGDRELTYDELNKAANRIAWAILERCGEKTESIALLFDHGIDVVCAILGALKAGKSYVALDISFPLQRLAYIIGETKCSWILANERRLHLVQQLRGNTREMINLEDLPSSLPFEDPKISVSPDDPFTITYTSGSTGDPKGVIETHLCRLHSVMVFTNDPHYICADDRLSLIHSVSFASGEVQLYRSLLNGAALLPFDLRSNSIDRLADWLRNEKITVCHLPVAIFCELAELLTKRPAFPDLRMIHLSGSPITRKHFELYRQVFADSLLALHMGSTETLVISTAVIDAKFKFPKEGTLLGYPVTDKYISLLDDAGKEVGCDEAGEIAVRSRYLPRGYLKVSQLDHDKIVSEPAGGEERTYMTGDLGRILPDGFLIHLGRRDHMVKIRGYRVNIGETERALAEHADVKHAGVVARDLGSGEQSLVGYLVSLAVPPPTVNELNQFLRARLPDYMIPSIYMYLESFPLVNGKLDRTRLPLPELKRPQLAETYVAPRSLTERILERIWADVLGLDCVGIHDNFFDLGGHSLAASQVIARVIQTLQLELPIKALFDSPTVAEMASIVAQNQATQASEDELAQMLREVEAVTEEEARQLVAKETVKG